MKAACGIQVREIHGQIPMTPTIQPNMTGLVTTCPTIMRHRPARPLLKLTDCNLAKYKSPQYSEYGDNEFDAMSVGNGLKGVMGNDWANPGKNSGTPVVVTSILAENHATEPGVQSGPVRPNETYSHRGIFASSLMGNLTGSYSENANDADGDGLYNSLILSVGVQINEAADYHVIAWLENGNGTGIAWAGNASVLGPGMHTVELFFDGLIIRSASLDGPYKIARVELLITEDDEYIDSANNVLTTAAYQYGDFESPEAKFNETYSSTGIDTGVDGLYDYLRLNVGVDIQTAGTYTIMGELDGSGSIAVASRVVSLSTGSQSVALDFDGKTIFQNRQDGPYKLRALRIEDADGNRIHFINDAYITDYYTYGDFQHSGSTINAASITDSGLDVDSDGDYDYLHLVFQVNVIQDGTYRFLAGLKDAGSKSISTIAKDVYLYAGSNTVEVNFPGGAIYEHGVHGPYLVSSLSFLDSSSTVLDNVQAAYATQGYAYTKFAPPLITFSGNIQDYGSDSNANGLYNTLNVNVSVTPGDAGVIVAHGTLVDSYGTQIQKTTVYKQMTAGVPQVITLIFDGGAIYSNKVNGPYKLRDLYIYHTADVSQGILVPQAYTTNAYSYAQFEVDNTSGAATTGVFRPSNGLLYLKNKNDTGFADMALNYGLPGDYPVVGDWDGNGTVTIGIYRGKTFYLRNENTNGFATIVFDFGQPGDQPIAGDWDRDGIDTIGIYRPSTGQFLLRNSNDAGPAEMSFYLGNVGDVGIAGDWNGDGKDTTGVFRPSNGVIFLKDTNDTGFADYALNYGLPGDRPVMGDWDNNGIDTIGIYRNGTFYLRNENTNGFATIVFGLGNPGDMPIAGNWDGQP